MAIHNEMMMCGRLQFPSTIQNIGTVFSNAALTAGDGWKEVDVSDRVPEDCRCVVCTIRLLQSADGQYIMEMSNNGTDGVNFWIGVRAADDSGDNVETYHTVLCPTSSGRKFWISAGGDEMQINIYLRGWFQP